MSGAEAEIAFLKLTIEKLRREMYGWRSERKQRLLDQLEVQLDELEARRERLAGRLAARKPLDLRGPRRRLFGRQLVLGRALSA